jgi:hypothetical protein
MKTNLMNYLALIYFFKQPLHDSGVFIAHHQEVFTVYVQQLVRVIRLGDWQLVPNKQNKHTDIRTSKGNNIRQMQRYGTIKLADMNN